MTTRRLLLFGLLAGLIVLGGGVWLLWPRTPRTALTWENAGRVRPGMALDEVEAALGGPARTDLTATVSYCLTDVEGFDPAARPTLEWLSDEVLVMVYLDANQRVQRCDALAVRREDQSIVEIVRRRLGL